MSQLPPNDPFSPTSTPSPFGLPVEPRRGNGLAVTGLVLGIVGFCVPVGPLALIFGALGLNKTKRPNVGGKGLAIAGLLLGLLTTAEWAGIGYVGYKFYRVAMSQFIDNSRDFLADLSDGNATGALAKVDPTTVDRARVEAAIESVRPFGKFQGIDPAGPTQISGANGAVAVNGVVNVRLRVLYEKGPKQVRLTMRQPDPSVLAYKIQDWTIE